MITYDDLRKQDSWWHGGALDGFDTLTIDGRRIDLMPFYLLQGDFVSSGRSEIPVTIFIACVTRLPYSFRHME